MRKSCIFLITALACATLAGCHSKPQTTVDKIEQLKQQVSNDATSLETIEKEQAEPLRRDFRTCDSLLQYLDEKTVKERFEQLNLTQAYLQQFGELKPVMAKKMDYVVLQLDRLKADAESQYLSDSLVLVYLADETKVADTLHQQVLYFQDRLGGCQKSLNQMKKDKK